MEELTKLLFLMVFLIGVIGLLSNYHTKNVCEEIHQTEACVKRWIPANTTYTWEALTND